MKKNALAAWTLTCVAWLVLVWTWKALHLAMTVDDTFYYFKTALNVSRGLGSTFDGINPTNGYHPLWLGVLAGLFALFGDDMVLLVKVAFTFQLVAIWSAGVVLSRLDIRGRRWVLWPLTLAMLNPFSAKIVLCGQETALQLLLSAVTLSIWWRLRGSVADTARLGRWALLGALGGLATLARLDTIFYAGLLVGMPVLCPSDAELEAGLVRRLRASVAGLAGLFAVLTPYLIFNRVVYRHLMPVSGAVKLHLETGESAHWAARLATVAVAAGGLAWLWRSASRRRATELPVLVPPVAACLILAIYNFAVRGEMGVNLVRIWYLEPYLLALAVGVGVLDGGPVIRAGGRTLAALVTRGAIVVWLVICALSWRYRLDPRSYALYAAAERCSRWFDATEPKAVAAAWDAGFAAAFTRKPVMNLDGLINSWEYKEQYLDGGRADAFILERHPVDYVIQYAWPRTLRLLAAGQGRHAGGSSARWSVDLGSFTVAHVECAMVSVAYEPSVTVGPVHYFVLRREPLPGRPTLAEFALRNQARSSCAPD
jgi:hypothetical protein